MKYSNNTGRPAEAVVVPTLSQSMALLEDLRVSGKVFRVDFKKRTTESNRTMICRCGVSSQTTGKGRKYNFAKKGLILVYEFGKGYRTVPLDNIWSIKHKGVIYLLNSTGFNPGTYMADSFPLNRKGTMSALTSPLYK